MCNIPVLRIYRFQVQSDRHKNHPSGRDQGGIHQGRYILKDVDREGRKERRLLDGRR